MHTIEVIILVRRIKPKPIDDNLFPKFSTSAVKVIVAFESTVGTVQ